MSELHGDWFLREWMTHFGKVRASLVTELGWEGKRAHQMWHGRQSYRRKDVAEVAAWLGIAPHELFMRPDDALKLRQIRVWADQIIEAVSSNQDDKRSA